MTIWGWHMPAAFSADGKHRYTLTRDLVAGATRVRAMKSHGRPAVVQHTFALTAFPTFFIFFRHPLARPYASAYSLSCRRQARRDERGERP